eukprot:maker-scaffold_9-snap-gene-9.0-mRNA-1 protein AED:0.00 eAED:0.00 QI:108/1/1/1/1/1/2/350/297
MLQDYSSWRSSQRGLNYERSFDALNIIILVLILSYEVIQCSRPENSVHSLNSRTDWNATQSLQVHQALAQFNKSSEEDVDPISVLKNMSHGLTPRERSAFVAFSATFCVLGFLFAVLGITAARSARTSHKLRLLKLHNFLSNISLALLLVSSIPTMLTLFSGKPWCVDKTKNPDSNSVPLCQVSLSFSFFLLFSFFLISLNGYKLLLMYKRRRGDFSVRKKQKLITANEAVNEENLETCNSIEKTTIHIAEDVSFHRELFRSKSLQTAQVVEVVEVQQAPLDSDEEEALKKDNLTLF